MAWVGAPTPCQCPCEGEVNHLGGLEMMSRFVCVVAFWLVGAACALPANADWIGQFAHYLARETKRRNCWPKPFVCADRRTVREPFAVMIDNGWRFQNMLGDHYFADETGGLTEAGRLKVHWIMTQAPLQHRSIHVYKAHTAEMTAARVESVRLLAAQFAPEGQAPSIMTSDIPPSGWPAARVEAIESAFSGSAPEPRLPAAAGGSTGGE